MTILTRRLTIYYFKRCKKKKTNSKFVWNPFKSIRNYFSVFSFYNCIFFQERNLIDLEDLQHFLTFKSKIWLNFVFAYKLTFYFDLL